MQWEVSTQFLQITSGLEIRFSFLLAEPELYIVKSFISNSDLKPDQTDASKFGRVKPTPAHA
jgi:hypothetical protein